MEIPIDGSILHGTVFVPSGPGPHPAVLLLHGFPGMPEWPEMARALQATGRTVLFFNYRGSWKSTGEYSFANALADAEAARSFLMSPTARERFRAAPTPVSLVGMSFGAWIALNVASRTPEKECIATLVLADLGRLGALWGTDSMLRRAAIDMTSRATIGERPPIRTASAASLVDDLIVNSARYDVSTVLPRLRDHRLFMLGATNDALAIPSEHHERVRDAAGRVPGLALTTSELPTDHGLSGRHLEANRAVAEWLSGSCRP